MTKLQTETVTRFEVIDDQGRGLVIYMDRNPFQILVQDDGKTVKVFMKGTIADVREAAEAEAWQALAESREIIIAELERKLNEAGTKV